MATNLYCVKCRGEMHREDDESYLCRKCGSIAYITGYMKYSQKVIPLVPLNFKKFERGDVPLYCESCAEKEKLVIIGYCKDTTSKVNRKRFCKDCMTERNREAQAKHYRTHGPRKKKKTENTESVEAVA